MLKIVENPHLDERIAQIRNLSKSKMRNRLGILRLMRSDVNCIVSDKEMEIVSKYVKDALILPTDVNLTVVVQHISTK